MQLGRFKNNKEIKKCYFGFPMNDKVKISIFTFIDLIPIMTPKSQALVARTRHHPLFSNFLFTNLFSITFLYFFPFLKDVSFCPCFCFVHTIAQFSRILRFSHIYCQIFRIRTHGWWKWRTTALASTIGEW
jgi:hypothetical protein